MILQVFTQKTCSFRGLLVMILRDFMFVRFTFTAQSLISDVRVRVVILFIWFWGFSFVTMMVIFGMLQLGIRVFVFIVKVLFIVVWMVRFDMVFVDKGVIRVIVCFKDCLFEWVLRWNSIFTVLVQFIIVIRVFVGLMFRVSIIWEINVFILVNFRGLTFRELSMIKIKFNGLFL